MLSRNVTTTPSRGANPGRKVSAMKKLLIIAAVLALSTTASAWEYNNPYGEQRKNNPSYQQDNYGSYTKQENLFKDNDRDGVPNRSDYNDNNPNIQRRGQQDNSFFDYQNNNQNNNRGHRGYK